MCLLLWILLLLLLRLCNRQRGRRRRQAPVTVARRGQRRPDAGDIGPRREHGRAPRHAEGQPARRERGRGRGHQRRGLSEHRRAVAPGRVWRRDAGHRPQRRRQHGLQRRGPLHGCADEAADVRGAVQCARRARVQEVRRHRAPHRGRARPPIRRQHSSRSGGGGCSSGSGGSSGSGSTRAGAGADRAGNTGRTCNGANR
mmetsp:Transcript_77803/g.252142  ORF Transcript_77803/g.252142 Transcript_77803/m.252142 type:complete len:200 (-) Transcript_77803:74-673(-)